MTNFVQIIKQCESAEGNGSKKVIQAALKEADDIAKQLIALALNPYITFGIKKIPKISQAYNNENYIRDFFILTDNLASRAITGKLAQNTVATVLADIPDEERPYFIRVLEKDLKSGFSASSANKAWDKEVIPEFDVMLADKCSSEEEFDRYVKFPCWADVKKDGQRTIAIVTAGQPVTYLARSGKSSSHLDGLFDEELQRIRNLKGYDLVFDGEVMGKNFTETINAKKEGNKEAKDNLQFNIFFMMPLTDWLAKKSDITMKQNREEINSVLNIIVPQKLRAIPGRMVTSYRDMVSYCNEVIDTHGEEGLILKDESAVYCWDRSFAWTKVKRFYDVDCSVESIYMGKEGTRLEGLMAGINVAGFLEDGTLIRTSVGSGFSDEDRAKTDWEGKVVVIKYQEVSKAKGSETASLRFPTYERTRDDKVVNI